MTSSLSLITLLATCSIDVSSNLLQPLIQLESGYNPYSIGVVGSSVHQPHSLPDFIQTVSNLDNNNKNYSIGLAQINIKNLNRFDIPVIDAVEPCNNIKLSSVILQSCYKQYNYDVGKTLSCYYSGNDKTGFKVDFDNSYVERFLFAYENKNTNVYIEFDYDDFYKLKKKVIQLKNSSKSHNHVIKENSKNSRKKRQFNKKINLN